MSRIWDKTSKPKTATLRPYTGALIPIEYLDSIFFLNKYEIPTYISCERIRLAPASQRYALPIYGPGWKQRGYVLRKPWDGAPRQAYEPFFELPKADTFMELHEPQQSFYRHYSAQPRPLIVVEDQLSALKAYAHGYDAVALLGTPYVKGTGFQYADRVAEIAREAGEAEVIVALDADATVESLHFVKKWGGAFKKIRAAILDRDLKDEPSKEFRRILGA